MPYMIKHFILCPYSVTFFIRSQDIPFLDGSSGQTDYLEITNSELFVFIVVSWNT